jgi:hypothetical protein
MSVASGDLGDVTGGHVKIGAAHHYGRNGAIAVGALVVAVFVIVFSSYSARDDASKLSQLETFRAAYADKCDVEAFRGPAAPLLRDTYLKTERLQAAVQKQQEALAAGVPCEEIGRALKTADFPMAAPTP